MIIGIHPKYLNLFFFSWSWRCLHELLSTEGGGDGEDVDRPDLRDVVIGRYDERTW